MTRGFAPLLAIVIAAGIAALSWATAGFRAVTSDGVRQISVAEQPRPVPEVRLIDQDGEVFSLGSYRGKTVLVAFIYTRCPTICGLTGDDFRRVLDRSRGGTGFDLLSISFDRDHDDRAALESYAERYGAAAPHWRVAAPADAAGLEALLRVFGVVVIPDGAGGFVHSGALYLVDPGGRLARILDIDASTTVIAAALRAAS